MKSIYTMGILVMLFCISVCVAAPASSLSNDRILKIDLKPIPSLKINDEELRYSIFYNLIRCTKMKKAIEILDNLEERPDLFEGDILLDPNNRNGIIGEAYRWPNRTVVYNISAEFSVDERIKILTAWAEIVNTTCIRFRQRTNELNYVFIQRGAVGSGCFSSVGKVGLRQILNLEPSCVPRHGTVVHEMIHTIGFYHEQARPDRDDFVTIVWDKIQPGKEHNFNKYDYDRVSTFEQPYNYGSVMHYSAVGFSIDGSPTIIPHDPDAVIGQRVGISQIDADKINIMYGCV